MVAIASPPGAARYPDERPDNELPVFTDIGESASPWRSARFRWYYAGSVTSWLGSAMAPIGLGFAVLAFSGNSGALGLVLTARSIPLITFMVLGGAVADRISRSRLLILSNLGSGITQGLVAFLILARLADLEVIVVLEVANGTFSAFTTPAMAGIVPQLVGAGSQQPANSLLSSARALTAVAGRSLAGVAVAAVGGGWAIGFDAATFCVAALCASRLGALTPPQAASTSLLADIRAGWTAFRSVRWIWVGSASVTVANCVQAGVWTVLGPATALHTFGPAAWGVVLSAQSAGLFVMSAVMYRFRPRRLLRFGCLCLPFGALPLFTLAFSTNVVALCATSFIAGLSFDALNVAWATSLQSHVPAGLLSRVSAIDNVGAFAAIPLGQVAVSPVAALAGTTRVEVVGGILFATLAALPLAVPEVRSLSQPNNHAGR
ncbi:MAG TPA: MFS transporter [Streptosporangiaceae bacterium]|nr:MFS transporter [Streptosporangiaceae bacterium]